MRISVGLNDRERVMLVSLLQEEIEHHETDTDDRSICLAALAKLQAAELKAAAVDMRRAEGELSRASETVGKAAERVEMLVEAGRG